MGVMNEPVAVEAKRVMAKPDFSKAAFEKVANEGCHNCHTEVRVNPGLNFVDLYVGIYEEGQPTNGIINLAKPWDVRMSWRLAGPLKELVCGYWCVSAHFESIGKGQEFDLTYTDIEFNCSNDCFSISIPGHDFDPEDCNCSKPYKVVGTVQYKSMCGKPGPILGFCELPVVQFFHSEY